MKPPSRPTPTPTMPSNRRKKKTRLTKANADRLRLYELAVQSPESEVEFVSRTFRRLRGRPARRLREDFCGSAACACEWVRTHRQNTALGLDLHGATLAWARRHNLPPLPQEARERIRLL